MHLFLTDPDTSSFLADELRRAAPDSSLREIEGLGIAADVNLDGLLLAFARQTLPDAIEVQAVSINAWADRIIDAVAGVFPDDQPWRLHLWPQYGEGKAGRHRCELILASLMERLKKRRRHLLRSLIDSEAVFDAQTSLAQCVLTSPETGWLSATSAPRAYALRSLISSFPRGEVPLADDKSAPSRAFTKLVEAEQRLGRRIERGETCVDLGASPGSWSYVALHRGAHVIAVDRSELREDLMRNPRLRFEAADAFKYQPPQTVDWLVCDVIAAPQRSIDLLLEWLSEKRMRNFIVTIKFKGHDEYSLLDMLKRDAPPLCAEFHLTLLCANKNEVCAFGVA
ncbi:SAM-dependent methyltransferase [Prosthecobacter sp.]|uniref:SAM-dependent methyltransferase n=1 Tax=Prosthecobacter sp. TaxID=1965333 RepID=UPI002AB9E41D|nr:SAM-dependent methyltransferase [Prosthecobacter sp.]MDZ4403143.1 SAM-dependent methyltransferase [Prosthecobacter sp.]